MFTLYTINSKSYYLPVKNITTVTDEMCVKKTTSDGRIIHVLYVELPGFLKAVFDELHLYSFDQLKYEIDPHRIHNRLNPLLNLPGKVLQEIISYVGCYRGLLHQTCQKFLRAIPQQMDNCQTLSSEGDLETLKKLNPKLFYIEKICKSAMKGRQHTEEKRIEILKWACKTKKYNVNKLNFILAAEYGQCKILEWGRVATNRFLHPSYIPRLALNSALQNGNISVLKWVDPYITRVSEVFDTNLSVELAKNGHLHILNWAIAKGAKLSELHLFVDRLAINGHLDILKWVSSQGKLDLNDIYKTLQAIEPLNRGQMEVIFWAAQNGLEEAKIHECLSKAKPLTKIA